jgi:hypothetical protein
LGSWRLVDCRPDQHGGGCVDQSDTRLAPSHSMAQAGIDIRGLKIHADEIRQYYLEAGSGPPMRRSSIFKRWSGTAAFEFRSRRCVASHGTIDEMYVIGSRE